MINFKIKRAAKAALNLKTLLKIFNQDKSTNYICPQFCRIEYQ